MVMGAEDAPVEVIEYASFTCPHCATFHRDFYPRLKEDYFDQGTVRFVHREFFRNRYDLWATMVARCAGPVRYFGVVDMLYETQRDWAQGEPATVAENLRRIGRAVGMGEEEIEACLTDGEFAQALVDRHEGHLEVHDVPGTPAFVINGEMHGGMSYTEMQELLDGLIAEAQG